MDIKPVIFNEKTKWYEDTAIYHWWLQSPMVSWYYDWKWKLFEKPLSLIAATWRWYKHVIRYDHDFESHFIFAILRYKFERVHGCMMGNRSFSDAKERHGHREIKAIKLAIKLADRLELDKYSWRAYEKITSKWGGRTPKDPLKKEQYFKYKHECYAISDSIEKRDRRWFFAIVEKYQPSWWD